METNSCTHRLIAIGVAEYASEDVADLPAVPAAVDAVVAGLAEFQYERVLQAIGLNPSRRGLDELERYCRERPGDEVIIVYYTGHGEVIDGRHMLQSSDFSPALPDASSLHAEALGRWLTAKADRAVLLVLDTCCASADANAILSGFFRAFPNFPANLAIVASALQRQYAYEGRFAAALCWALEEAQRGRKCGGPESPFLSLDGIIDLVNDHMAEAQAKDGGDQRARLIAMAHGVLPFFRNPNYRPQLPAVTTLAAQNALTGAPDGAEIGAPAQVVSDLLTTLAFAPGHGLPFENVLRIACAAVTGRSYSDSELEGALQSASASVCVDASTSAETTLYRLSNPDDAKRLRWGHDDRVVNKRLAVALMQLVPVLDSRPELKFAHPYLRKHLPTLAVGAGVALLAGAALSQLALGTAAATSTGATAATLSTTATTSAGAGSAAASGGVQTASSAAKFIATAKAAVGAKVAAGVGVAAIITAGAVLRPPATTSEASTSPATGIAPVTESSRIGGGNKPPVAVVQAEIVLDRAVNAGAFVVRLKSAKLGPDPSAPTEGVLVTVDFVATNISHRLVKPLHFDILHSYGWYLDYGGKRYHGRLEAHEVPAGRSGIGTLTWNVGAPSADSTTLFRDATMTFGLSEQNQIVVPFADPSDAVTLADIP